MYCNRVDESGDLQSSEYLSLIPFCFGSSSTSQTSSKFLAKQHAGTTCQHHASVRTALYYAVPSINVRLLLTVIVGSRYCYCLMLNLSSQTTPFDLKNLSALLSCEKKSFTNSSFSLH